MERKRERIDELRAHAHELREKSKRVERSVTAPKEQMELLISAVLEMQEAINELHTTTVEILEAVRESMAVPESIPEKRPAKVATIEEKPLLDLRGLFRLKPKKSAQ
ncbi:hypothetical protein MUP77_12420 [Candidatus Bathyarchaeota archaeon]|nr:hypothetical protein [Candidatus Bathyarchaeota archaeon]